MIPRAPSGSRAACASPSRAIGINDPAPSVTPGTAPAADVIYIAADNETTEQVGTQYLVNGSARFNLFDDPNSMDTGNTINIDTKPPTVTRPRANLAILLCAPIYTRSVAADAEFLRKWAD